ncbi:MAG TPA: hypothetical protein VFN37_01145 [Candidatus Baltobacteraceae bacterium]|nr:hypothetical protein [Candidatus Baltobacteraceae bacterium]
MATRCPAAAADPAPIRHLEYHVSGHTTVNAQSESYDGTSSGMGSVGYDGTMSVDVLALAKDGGMVVRASVMMNGEIRPEEAVTCAVYGDGRVICPQNAPISGAMHVLFSRLGRDFYDPSIVDASGKWTRNDDGGGVSADATFTSTPTKDPNVLEIREHLTVEPRGQIASGWTDEAQIRYNTALSVPLSIHDVSTPDSRSDNGGVEITDMDLKSDSFAKH